MKSNQDRRIYWQEQMVLWASSGMAQRKLCAANRLSFSSFSQWRQKFRQEETLASKSSVESSTLTTAFVPARVMDIGGDTACRLRSPDGWEIVLPTHVTVDWIAKLLHCVRTC